MSLKDLKSKSDQALASIPAARHATAIAAETPPSRPVTAPGAAAFMQPTIDALNERAKKAEAKAAEFEEKLRSQPTEVALNLLEEVDVRKRKLTVQQFEELKENLRANPLVHPVAVKALDNGHFEIVSGHNRVAAYRALGRNTIPVVVVNIENGLLDRSAFYANLLQPALPDFEKYLGFKRERDATGATQKQLAKAAGVAESVVSMLFAFGQLPVKAIELIEERPETVGMNCAAELARLAKEGHEEKVIEAVELLVMGRFTQKEALKYAAQKKMVLRSSVQASPVVKIRAGRLDFCRYVTRGNAINIVFKVEEHRAEAEAKIAALLQELADGARRDS